MDDEEQYESPSETEEDHYKEYKAKKKSNEGGQSREDESQESEVYEEDVREDAAPPDDEEETAEGEDDDEDDEEEAAGADEGAAAAPEEEGEGAEADEGAEGDEAPEEDEGAEGDEEGGGGSAAAAASEAEGEGEEGDEVDARESKGPWDEGEDEFEGDFDEMEGEDPGALGKRLSQIRDPFPVTDETILEHLLQASKQAYARIARIEDIRSFIKEYEEVRDQEGRPKDEKQPPEIKKAREDLIKELEKFDAIVRRIDRLCSLTNVYSPEDYLPPLQRQPIAEVLGKRLSELMDQLELEKLEKQEAGCCAYCAREEALPKMVVCGTTDHVPMVVFCDPGGRKLGKPPDCDPSTCSKRGAGGGPGGGGGPSSFMGRKYRECDRFHGPEDIAGVAGANAILDQVNYMADEIKKLRLENMKLSYRLNSMNVFQEVDDSIARAAMSRGAGGAGPLTSNPPCARQGPNFRQTGMSYGGRQGSGPAGPSSAMMPDSMSGGRPQYSGPPLSVAPPPSCGIASCHTSRGGGGMGGGFMAPLPLHPLRLRGSGVALETKSNPSFAMRRGARARSCSFGSHSPNIPCLRLRGAGPAGGCTKRAVIARSPLRPPCHPQPPPPRPCGLTPDPCPPVITMRSSSAGPGHRTWPPQKPQNKSDVFGSGPWLSQRMGAKAGSGVGGLSCPNCAPSGVGFNRQEPAPPKEPPGCACEYKDPMTSPMRPSQDMKQRRWYGKSCVCPPTSFGSSEYCECECNRGMGPKSDSRPAGWQGPNADAQCVPECSATSDDVDRDGCAKIRPMPPPCCEPKPCFDPLNICKGPDPQCPDMVSQMERQLQDMECDVARMKRELSIMQRFNAELEKESTSSKCPCPETSKCKPEGEDGKDGKGKKDRDKSAGKDGKGRDKSSGKDRNGKNGRDNSRKGRNGNNGRDNSSGKGRNGNNGRDNSSGKGRNGSNGRDNSSGNNKSGNNNRDKSGGDQKGGNRKGSSDRSSVTSNQKDNKSNSSKEGGNKRNENG